MTVSPLFPHRLHPPFVAAMIIPTGVGAAIGGFAGDATPYLNLLASVSDVVVTHPNVANAGVFQQLPGNALYVEGYALDQYMQGNWALQPVAKNRIGIVFDAKIDPEMLTLHLNTINAAQTVYGLDIVGYTVTDSPVETTCTLTSSGCSSGTLRNPAVILNACIDLVNQGATAIALCTQLPELSTEEPSPEDTEDSEQETGIRIIHSSLPEGLPDNFLAAAMEAHARLQMEHSGESEDGFAESGDLDRDEEEEFLFEADFNQEDFGNLAFADDDPSSRDMRGGNSDTLPSDGQELPDGLDAELMADVINTLLDDSLSADLTPTEWEADNQAPENNQLAETPNGPIQIEPALSPDKDKADIEADYRQGKGVDPIGGLEGILSHLVVSELGIPCAHAPVFPWDIAKPTLDEVLDPRAAAEFIAPTFLPCVLTGLRNAPQLRPMAQVDGTELTINDLSVLVTPADAMGGLPVLAALERGIPIIAVADNQTVLSMDRDVFLLAPPNRRHLIHVVRSYEEAAGKIQMMRLGISPPKGPVQRIKNNK